MFHYFMGESESNWHAACKLLGLLGMRMIRICQVFVLFTPLLGEMRIPLNYPADPYHNTHRHAYTQPGESPGSLFTAETSSYCNCNLHCNLCVTSDACVAHPAWIKHKLSAQEDCAVGAQRAGCWWGCLGGKSSFARILHTEERAENVNSPSRATQGRGFPAEGFLFDWKEENNSRGEAFSQRRTWGQLILSTSCGDERSRARKGCRWSIMFCLHLLHKAI